MTEQMSHPPFGMEKEITQIRYNPITQPTYPTSQPYGYPQTTGGYTNYIKPGCFREKKPCDGCIWRNECGNVERGCQGDK